MNLSKLSLLNLARAYHEHMLEIDNCKTGFFRSMDWMPLCTSALDNIIRELKLRDKFSAMTNEDKHEYWLDKKCSSANKDTQLLFEFMK